MANFRECLVQGGRAYVDAGDVAAVIVRGDDFASLAPPDKPLRLLLSGCGDSCDIFGVSVEDLFGWLNPDKFQRLRMRGGHIFLHARHIVGLIMSGDSDTAASTATTPLRVLIRGARSPQSGWGISALDFLHWMQLAGREVKVTYLDPVPA